MKVLFIGGTGTISMAITKGLVEKGHDVYLFNRGSRNSELPKEVKFIRGDINNEAEAAEKLAEHSFDVVCDFIGFVPSQLERDLDYLTERPDNLCISVLHQHTRSL